MRVAYYFDEFPFCNLTDLQSFMKCSANATLKDPAIKIFIRFCQLMLDPIQFIGFSREQPSENKTVYKVFHPKLIAIVNGLADTTLYRSDINEDRFEYLSFAVPFSVDHFAIAVNRELVQLHDTYDSHYYVYPFNLWIWVIFIILSYICNLFDARFCTFATLKFRLLALAIVLHSFLSQCYNSALRADFARSVVHHVPYRSIDDLTQAILENQIQLMTGDSKNLIARVLETSQKDNWKRLKEALKLRPFANFGNSTAENCKEVAKNRSIVMIDKDYNFQVSCSSEQKKMQIVLLKDEPVTKTAYVFPKGSKYLEKAMRSTEFIAAEYTKGQRDLLNSELMLPTSMNSIHSLIIHLFDAQNLFKFYAISLIVIVAEFAAEIVIGNWKN